MKRSLTQGPPRGLGSVGQVVALRDICLTAVDPRTGFGACEFSACSSYMSRRSTFGRTGWAHLKEEFLETEQWSKTNQGKQRVSLAKKHVLSMVAGHAKVAATTNAAATSPAT